MTDRKERDALGLLRTALDHLRAAERACEEVGYSRMNVLDPLANLRLDLTVVIATVSDGDDGRVLDEGQQFRCVKCGYQGALQVGHERPNGTGECGYIAARATGEQP